MNVRKFKWSRALALFLAMTMVMMYSVTMMSFAEEVDGVTNIEKTPPPTVGTITVTKDVKYEGETSVNPNDSHPFAFTYVQEVNAHGENDVVETEREQHPPLLSGSGIVSETSSPSITLPFGTYLFTETEVDDDNYKGEKTSFKVKIDSGDRNKEIKFINTKPTPTEGSITVMKDVQYEGETQVNPNDSHPFEFTYVEKSNGHEENDRVETDRRPGPHPDPILLSGSGIVSETSSPSITLPFGTYLFTETDVEGDNYTGVTTSFSVTVSLENLNPTDGFINSKPLDTIVETGRTTTLRSSTPVTPVIPEPVVPLADLPAVTPVITDQPTPLADVVPQTSDTGNIWLLLALMLGSGAGIAVVGRKKQINGK